MAMNVGGGDGPAANINVTPLIDVLLVLLIIFMVITPMTPKGLDALVPQPPKPNVKNVDPPERTIVVQVINSRQEIPTVKINQDEVRYDDLQSKLTDIFKTRAERVAFVKGDSDLEFDQVAKVIDKVHAAGVDKVGLITAKIEAGN